MKYPILSSVRTLAALFVAVSLSSCSLFRAKEIEIERRSSDASRAYYDISVGRVDELSFETMNFLSSNLLLEQFRNEPGQLVRQIAAMQEREPSQQTLSVLSDICFYMAQKSRDENEAVQYDLAAAYYSYQQLFNEHARMRGLGKFDPSIYQAARTYNSTLSRLCAYLKRKQLLHSDSFQLSAADGRKITFRTPRYELVFPSSSYRDFLLCSDFQTRRLSHFTHEFGLGVPVIAVTDEQNHYKTLKTQAPIAHGATVFLRFLPGSDELAARLEFYDNDRIRSISVGSEQQVPLNFDYSTPFAYYVSTLPDMDLIKYMLRPAASSGRPELYTLEPYHPDKIPVVLVHGLMSSIHTWMQMINTLKNDPQIRKHCQFWFFTYSSGNPILYSAALFRNSIMAARAELATTPEARANFDKMVIISHSMGGLISKTAIQDPGETILRKITGQSWEQVRPQCTPEQQQLIRDTIMFESIPSVRRILFLAVPHRGAALAEYTIANIGSSLVKLPNELVVDSKALFKKFFVEQTPGEKTLSDFQTGIDGLRPDSPSILILNGIPLKPDVPCHSIIGNREAANLPGGTDGVVPYSSSHLDQVRSELIVRSGHSVQRHPVAIHEVRRILLLHLKENNVR